MHVTASKRRFVARALIGAMATVLFAAPSADAQQARPRTRARAGDVLTRPAQGRLLPRSPAPAPALFVTASAQVLRDSIVALARAQVGRRYRLGGGDPSRGFDCSGLIRYVLAALDMETPRTARQQASLGLAVVRDVTQLQPGDIVTFGVGRAIDHIGIYVGDGRFVHASSVAGRVIESPLDRPRAARIKPWAGVRRIVTEPDSPLFAGLAEHRGD